MGKSLGRACFCYVRKATGSVRRRQTSKSLKQKSVETYGKGGYNKMTRKIYRAGRITLSLFLVLALLLGQVSLNNPAYAAEAPTMLHAGGVASGETDGVVYYLTMQQNGFVPGSDVFFVTGGTDKNYLT